MDFTCAVSSKLMFGSFLKAFLIEKGNFFTFLCVCFGLLLDLEAGTIRMGLLQADRKFNYP